MFGAPNPNDPEDEPFKAAKDSEFLVTLWPSFPHFARFANDTRLAGIRLNSAMMAVPEVDKELAAIDKLKPSVPLFFDIKGRQPRITEVIPNKKYLDLRLNHPVEVKTPSVVIFKGGADYAVLDRLEEDGQRLIFQGGPKYNVLAGESLYLRDPSLRIKGNLFIDSEKEKIAKVRAAGFDRYFLSYVEEDRDIDEFLELTGRDVEVWLKIESMRGLSYVANNFKKRDNLILVAARGDLYVEIDKPHNMAKALKLIADKDPAACVASRLLLSVAESPVPSCADFLELQWLSDVGYRRFMLCDELCLKEELMGTSINAFESFRTTL
jgi:hypothetical protein